MLDRPGTGEGLPFPAGQPVEYLFSIKNTWYTVYRYPKVIEREIRREGDNGGENGGGRKD